MNIAYYRKSNFSKEETIERLRKTVGNYGLEVIGEVPLESINGLLLQVCGNKWIDKLLKKIRNLIGLVPCSVLVVDNDWRCLYWWE